MEARINWTAARAAAGRVALLAAVLLVTMGASQRSNNFIVETPDPNFARQLSQAAEKYRHDLAIEWLGKPMPDWSQPCVMTVKVEPRLSNSNGGATSFNFDQGEVFGWRMSIQGSPERLLDSVLPHEITHMVFASHFRQPLPRWADEGGATSVEHFSEKNKHREMLGQFLRTGRGIAFNQMFAIMDYPSDIMPLYAEGYALAEFSIQTGGRRKFIEFLDDGMKSKDWPGAIQRGYGIKDLGVLQNTWLAWVGQGWPRLTPRDAQPAAAAGDMLASNQRRPRPEPNLIYHVPDRQSPDMPKAGLVPVHFPSPPNSAGPRAEEGQGATTVASTAPVRPSPTAMKWSDPTRPVSPPAERITVADPRVRPGGQPVAGWHAPGESVPPAIASPSTPPSVDPFRTQVAHPQPLEQTRQTVLQ